MGHVPVLAQSYVLTPWVLWFLHSFHLPTCVPLPDRLLPCCLPEVSSFGPPPCFCCGLLFPIRVVVARLAAPLSPAWPLSLSVALPLALSLIALALATLALVALALAALALTALALAALALSALALVDLALADLVLAVLVGGPGLI